VLLHKEWGNILKSVEWGWLGKERGKRGSRESDGVGECEGTEES